MKILQQYKEQVDLKLPNKMDFSKEIIPFLKNNEIKSDDTVIMLYVDNMYIEFNVISAIIWNGIKKDKTKDEIIDFIATTFSVQKKIVENDFESFINDLRNKEIIG